MKVILVLSCRPRISFNVLELILLHRAQIVETRVILVDRATILNYVLQVASQCLLVGSQFVIVLPAEVVEALFLRIGQIGPAWVILINRDWVIHEILYRLQFWLFGLCQRFTACKLLVESVKPFLVFGSE